MRRINRMALILIIMCIFCKKAEIYNVYFCPLENNYYLPLTIKNIREEGDKFNIQSEKIDSIFHELINLNGKELKPEDTWGYRIIIENKDKNYFIITDDKTIIYNNKKININNIDSIIKILYSKNIESRLTK